MKAISQEERLEQNLRLYSVGICENIRAEHLALLKDTGEWLSAEDEIIVAECDLDRAARARKARWNWDYNREPRHYGIIVDGPGRSAPVND